MADPSLTPDQIEARSFTSGFRGYDQSEVREFLSRVAAEVRALRDRGDRLESAWHSAEERAARPPVLDEDTLISAVGEETATILRAARAAAADLRTRAGEDAERVLADARTRSVEITAEAEAVLSRETRTAEEAASRLIEAARSEAAEVVDKARVDADTIRAAAEQERALTVEGAISTRERILDDLSRRRRVASVQIEQLRAGRERLLESYAVVRRTLEEVNDELNRADAEARAAADEVGRRLQRDHPHPEPPAPSEGAPEDATATPADGAQDGAEGSPADETTTAHPGPEAGQPSATQVSALPHAAAPGSGVTATRSGTEVLATAVDHPPAGEPAGPHLWVVSDPPDTMVPGSQVDLLFARIRAGRVDAGEVPDDGPALESDATDEEESLLQRREAAVGDLELSLTRKLKRTLQDEQNDLLDRLRSLRGEPSADRLLPELAAQTAHYADAAQPLVDGAAVAGVAFALEILQDEMADRPGPPVVNDLAVEAATTIVESLRRRLEHAISASAGDEQYVLVEAVGAAYREWKSERIERIAGDVLAAAFSRGTWHAVPEGGGLRWIVEDTDGPCPDCDDDALAGSLPKGEAFPTGQPHPPAHTGCRCLLVPVTG